MTCSCASTPAVHALSAYVGHSFQLQQQQQQQQHHHHHHHHQKQQQPQQQQQQPQQPQQLADPFVVYRPSAS